MGSDAAKSARTDGLPVGTDSIVTERVLRIGELDGALEYAFGSIVAIQPAPDGGFYACDGNDVSIRRYDAAETLCGMWDARALGPVSTTIAPIWRSRATRHSP